jgi:hypothetical protein
VRQRLQCIIKINAVIEEFCVIIELSTVRKVLLCHYRDKYCQAKS